MGVVFSAFDPELARPVAIKVLRSGGSPERMKREAQALAKLTHANVVTVYDVGEHEGATFVAMALAAAVAAWLFLHRGSTHSKAVSKAPDVPLKNPFSLTAAAKFAAFFAVVLLVVALVQMYWPGRGLYMVAALAGLTDVDAITLSICSM